MRVLTLLFLLFTSYCYAQRVAVIGDKVQKVDYLANLKQQLKLEWPDNKTIHIVFHGHSVPAGYFQTPHVNTLAAYPQLFLKFLKEKYPTSVVNTITTAIGGEQSEQGSKRFQTEVLNINPDLIFIDYALNDRTIGLERAEAAWSAMIEQALDKKIKIVLLTPTPDLTEDILAEDALLQKFTQMILRLGEEYQLPVVDVYTAFKTLKASGINLKTYMSQSNHPNELGHQLVLLEIVKTLFNKNE
ncbi:MAG: SGNH/GDSL hydrolase family protein [Bacteroidota bacterium]